jgi:hypothetical protein
MEQDQPDKPVFSDRLSIAMDREDVDAIDAWRRKHPDIPPRSTAARMLIRLALAAGTDAGEPPVTQPKPAKRKAAK